MQFEVNCSGLKTNGQTIKSMASSIERAGRQTQAIQNRLAISGAGAAAVRAAIKSISANIGLKRNLADQLGDAAVRIADLYAGSETKIAQMRGNVSAGSNIKTGSTAGERLFLDDGSFWDWIRKNIFKEDSFTEETIDTIVTDKKGSYGGNQGSPESQFGFWSQKKDLYEAVREYHPDWNDKQISDYLKKLNSEGCGYVMLVNTIMMAYQGREEEFEKTFGFPMMRGKEPDYNRLLVHLYTDTDNHNKGPGGDEISTTEDESATEGLGTSYETREYRLNKFLDDKNADVEVSIDYYTSDEITPDNIMNYMDTGQKKYLAISYFYGNLQDESGKTVQEINGGHTMLVTGVTSDGRYVVSSWGKKYYIDPNETVSMQVTADDGTVSTERTYFYFEQYDYDF